MLNTDSSYAGISEAMRYKGIFIVALKLALHVSSQALSIASHHGENLTNPSGFGLAGHLVVCHVDLQ